MPRRRTSVFEKMFSDNRLRSIPDSEQQSTLCVEYWTSKILSNSPAINRWNSMMCRRW